MTAAAEQKSGWGLRQLFLSESFKEFLFDTNSELGFPKECSEGKYSIIAAALRCPRRNLLGNEIVQDLQKSFDKGPFYIKVQRNNDEPITKVSF